MAIIANPPLRKKIAKFVNDDQELIRAFETLFGQALNLTPTEIAALAALVQINTADIAQINTNVIFVTAKADLPAPVAGVITLVAGKTYWITTHIDLTGDRLETGGVVTLTGSSSETSSLTSTGLALGVPLLTSRYTLPMRFLTIRDVDTGFYLDDDGGANAPLAVDWFAVNFSDVPNVGTVGDVDNFIFDTGAFLSSNELVFTGTVGTAGFTNNLFSGSGAAGDIIRIAATAVITRRFRIIYSSIVAFGATVGINASTSASIPVEGFILDTINFSGGSTYVSGVQENDNKSRWSDCRGVRNSAAISSYNMNGNVTATVIAVIGTAVKVAGTTTSATITQRFTNTSNRATYIGAIQRDFKVTAVLSVTSGSNNVIGVYVAKNGTIETSSEVYLTANAAGRAENGTCQVIVALTLNDYVEIFVENSTAVTDITVSDLNVIVEALN